MKPVIDMERLDPGFAGEIARHPGGAGVRMCFHCGTCSAGCPVREIDATYNPRNIIRMAVLGMREEVLNSSFIWFCSTCFNCHERCPQGVSITEVMTVLRNMAVKAGYIHPAFRLQAGLIGKNGRLYEVEDFDNKKRKKNSLPEVTKSFPEVQEIFRLCHLDRFLPQEE